MSKLREDIFRLKREKSVTILAHYYCAGDVQEVADFVGDSLALSVKASEVTSDVILFAGVRFMGQTAKILSPDKIVLEVDIEAGCSLADSCDANKLAEFKALHPDHLLISYVNTTAEVKAITDICCTSSNAVQIVDSLPKEQKIIFAPDRNLGNYIKQISGRDNMIIWDGACHVHDRFSLEGIRALMSQVPDAKVLVHPESPAAIVELGHCVGSTAMLLDYVKSSDAKKFIVVTESGIIYNMQQIAPDKEFFAAPYTFKSNSNELVCNDCEYMKLNTLPKIIRALETLSPQVEMDERLMADARKSIDRMIEISKKLNLT